MKDMLGQEVVIGDTVIFTDYKDEDNDYNLTGGIVVLVQEYSIDVEDMYGNYYNLCSPKFAYYTTIKDLTL